MRGIDILLIAAWLWLGIALAVRHFA